MRVFGNGGGLPDGLLLEVLLYCDLICWLVGIGGAFLVEIYKSSNCLLILLLFSAGRVLLPAVLLLVAEIVVLLLLLELDVSALLCMPGTGGALLGCKNLLDMELFWLYGFVISLIILLEDGWLVVGECFFSI